MRRFLLCTIAAVLFWTIPLASHAARRMKIVEIRYKAMEASDRDPNTKGFAGLADLGTGKNVGWGVIGVKYATAPRWANELTVKLFVLLGAGKDFTMLTGSTTYIHVPRGREHMAYSFMHPNITARFGSVQRVRAEIWYNGVLEDEMEWPETSAQPWWTRIRPLTGNLLVKFYTPLARVAQNEEPIKMEER